ncbi:MAG: PQQ-binding-like beta-propeller repeat protein, partial [Planctomycetaceae bacterium]
MTCTESPIAKSVAAVWFLIPFLFLLPDSGKSVSAADWPMWRHDAARSGASAAAFPDKLHLQWIRQLPEPMPAWPESQPKLNFDRYCQPVVSGQHLLLSSTVSESVCAFNTRTGRREWVFLTNGPVRFAPAIADGRVYVTSDDGYLYCLDLETGQRIWKVLGGPYAKQIIGNDRLISMWPCRGGVVVKDGMVCFAAGIWPSMGVFIRAVDAQSGKILWTNSTTGSKFVRHPHGADAFGSISPQGCLSISGNNLIVPGGRTLPGVFDLQTGEMRHFEFGGKGEGGHDVFVSGGLIHVRGEAFHVTDGQSVGNVPADFVGRGIVGLVNSKLIVTDPRGSIQEETVKDRKGKAVRKTTYRPLRRESFELAGPSQRIFMEAGAQVFAAEPGRIAAYRYTELPGRLQPHWTHSTDTPGSSGSSSQAVAMIAADDRLFVVMSDSRLLCFGPDKSGDPAQLDWQTGTGDPVAALPETVPLSVEPDRAGYAVSLVPPRQDTLHRLLNQTRMKLISYQRPESSPGVPAGQDFWTHDRYGDRFTFRSGQVDELEQPPYFASLVFCDVKKTYTAREIRTVFSMLRPYGGECRLAASQSTHQEIVGFTAGKSSATDVFQGAEITRDGEWTVIRRPGPLPDAGVWTHQYGDSANSVVSTDARVKAPLGLLWFGGPSNDRVLPRHGHGPSPQVAGGRLFIEGADMLRCVDVYTGRVWWERDLPGLGTYYNNTAHHPGAGEIGSNYVSLEDCVYVIHEQKLLALNVETGRTQFEFQHTGTSGVPAAENRWGALAVEGDLLVATASPVALVPDEKDGGSDTDKAGTDAVPGNTVAVIPPHSEWKYQAGPDPRNDWTNVSFDDAKWPRGSAGFGYGDKDDATVLKDMQNRYSRVYIRHEFQLPASIDAGELRQFGARLQLLLKYDDAFIAYLNGQEFARSGIGSGRGSLAKELSGHEAKRYDTFIPREGKTLIRPGKNVIAIEGHNSGIDSSDFTLDPFLVVSVDDDFRKVTAKLQPDAVEPPGKRSLLDMLLPAEYSSVSRLLSVFDRHTGQFHWSRAAKFGFRHNAIC